MHSSSIIQIYFGLSLSRICFGVVVSLLNKPNRPNLVHIERLLLTGLQTREIDNLYFCNRGILTDSVMIGDHVLRGNQGLRLSQTAVVTDCRILPSYIKYLSIYRNNLKRNPLEYLHIDNFYILKVPYLSDPIYITPKICVNYY
jgi:hypothetical protein